MCRFESWGISLNHTQIIFSFCWHIWSNTTLEKYLMDYKQLLDKVFVITGIIKIEVGVMKMLSETLIILDITKTKSNNCFIIHCMENNGSHVFTSPIASNTKHASLSSLPQKLCTAVIHDLITVTLSVRGMIIV